MSALGLNYRVVLDSVLDTEYLPNLPPLLISTKPQDEQLSKNRSRAFSAFALHNICDIPKVDAAKAVI